MGISIIDSCCYIMFIGFLKLYIDIQNPLYQVSVSTRLYHYFSASQDWLDLNSTV